MSKEEIKKEVVVTDSGLVTSKYTVQLLKYSGSDIIDRYSVEVEVEHKDKKVVRMVIRRFGVETVLDADELKIISEVMKGYKL